MAALSAFLNPGMWSWGKAHGQSEHDGPRCYEVGVGWSMPPRAPSAADSLVISQHVGFGLGLLADKAETASSNQNLTPQRVSQVETAQHGIHGFLQLRIGIGQ